uniref:DNA-directed RNA polymerase I subunit RPA34 isoform X2 n=1 Tax=Pristiophorus japonicus TaxID=55135 RepID=UPI00398E7C01
MAKQRWEVSSSEPEDSEAEREEGGVAAERRGGRSGEAEAAEPKDEQGAGRCPGKAASFSGKKIPLVGFQTLKSKTCRDKLYNVFGTSSGAGGVCLVLPAETAGRPESCPQFAGCITVAESWAGRGTNDQPHSIPASPAPSLPPGLKRRFRPFGAAPAGWSPRKRRRAPSGTTTPELGGAGDPGAKRGKRAKGKAAGGEDEPGHEAADRQAPSDSPGKKKKTTKRSREREEAAFRLSDTGTPEPEHGKQEKLRRKDKHSKIPQTAPRELDLGHKKKKKKKDKK